MTDLNHNWDGDLSVSVAGGLSLVQGTSATQQRILRRLLTNPGAYLWQPDYGAGLPAFVGQTLDIAAVTGAIQSQLLLESAVAADPMPVISVTPIDNGLYVSLTYIDAGSGQQAALAFDVNG